MGKMENQDQDERRQKMQDQGTQDQGAQGKGTQDKGTQDQETQGQGTCWQMEDLIPLVAKLADRYTSLDSSSVSYETAQMLMEAVIYCIREWEEQGGCLPSAGAGGIGIDWEPAYRAGYERVLEKVRQAKRIYEDLIADFEDYGCRNYRDTIIKGMPGFFVNYDPRFCPQDHILMLDYPAMSVPESVCGVDLILEYLRCIRMEAGFLRLFPREHVVGVLWGIMPEYRSLYLGNICTPVLMRAAGCVIAGRSVLGLELSEEDYRVIEAQFRGIGRSEAEGKLLRVTGMMAAALPGSEFDGAKEYFSRAAREYAVRAEFLKDGHFSAVF